MKPSEVIARDMDAATGGSPNGKGTLGVTVFVGCFLGNGILNRLE